MVGAKAPIYFDEAIHVDKGEENEADVDSDDLGIDDSDDADYDDTLVTATKAATMVVHAVDDQDQEDEELDGTKAKEMPRMMWRDIKTQHRDTDAPSAVMSASAGATRSVAIPVVRARGCGFTRSQYPSCGGSRTGRWRPLWGHEAKTLPLHLIFLDFAPVRQAFRRFIIALVVRERLAPLW